MLLTGYFQLKKDKKCLNSLAFLSDTLENFT